MRKYVKRSTIVVVSMFFLISLTDAPDNRALTARNNKNTGIISADAAMNIEHRAFDNKNEGFGNDFDVSTEEMFAAIKNITPEPQVIPTSMPAVVPTTAPSSQDQQYASDTSDIKTADAADNQDNELELFGSDDSEEDLNLVLQEGIEDPIIAELQQRLMELGFMEYAEPTQYFGSITKMSVMLFQRQNDITQDGIVNQEIFDMIMSPDAKLYLVKKGVTGDDVLRIQTRLYETGYLTSNEYITGYFGDITEQAVMKMQEINGLNMDGIIGQHTFELLYSEDIKSNYIAAGEKSEEVLKYQNRLRELGYLTTTPDGVFGADTVAAVKQFQSRNDLIVDGYLGPTTCQVLESTGAAPNGLSLGDRSDSVKRVQELLSKYGYMTESNATGYYGEITQAAVKNFQSANGLTADGMAGKQTMAVLTGGSVKKASSNAAGTSSSSSSSTSSASSGSTASQGSVQDSGSVSTLINVALSKLGCKYVYGSRGPNSFDCSGFVYWCLNQAGVKQSYMSSYGWRSVNKYVKITNFSDIRAGDIVVVKGHVGIAAYNGTVIDASSSSGKIVHRDLGDWWKKNFIVAWRIF